MLYELRIYHSMPNKLPALLKRFEMATVALFEKHGFRQVGYWTTAIGESNADLHYILAWESMEERDRKFAAFAKDPDWIAARTKSEENGPLISSFSNSILTPTKFSALK